MKEFKKRTIALVLASVVTVAGSFAAGNYKNSLMSLKFDTSENGSVNMSVETKNPYTGNVTPIRRDANTYILTLSEMNNLVKGTIDLQNVAGNINSVEVKTLPYTNSQKGYTRIIIKTQNTVNIIGKNKIFIPSQNTSPQAIPTSEPSTINNTPIVQEVPTRPSAKLYEPENRTVSQEHPTPETLVPYHPYSQNKKETSEVETPAPQQDTEIKVTEPVTKNNIQDKDPLEGFLLIMGILLILTIVVFLAIRAKNKLQEITGEKMDIDVSDDEDIKPKKESKRKQIKNTIKKLDSTYAKSAIAASKIDYPKPQEPAKVLKPAEELNVVDLDELFKEQQELANQEESENDALEDFLSGFSFDELEGEQDESAGYDIEFYDKIINSNTFNFTKNDIECINQLLASEINEEAIEAIKNQTSYVTKPSKQEILEDLVTNYTISQNISFTKEDIDTLRKLISVEIDNDFITNLRTNPERTKEMQAEILADKPKKHKPSEILTLNVKDILPDLSEALRKQGGRRIESEVKPITVYASEGYEVNTLSLDDALPDLSIEINNKNAYISQPSAEFELVDTSYEVEKLSTSDMLPNLADAIKNPEKYNQPEPEPVIVDEESLLKNISNVQFKPFYDGSESFEILNDFETPSIDDIKNEFSQFENFETANNEEEVYTLDTNDDYDDFEALYNNEYFDLDNLQGVNEGVNEGTNGSVDKTIKKEIPTTPKAKEEFIPRNLERKRDENTIASKRIRTKLSDDILKKIEATKAERLKRREKALENKKQKTVVDHKKTEEQKTEIKCIIDGKTYNIVNTVEFSENKGCHLAKSENGYTVFGFIGDKFIKLKEFDSLKSERIASRLSEKVSDSVSRYIIRIGLEKFILNVANDNIEYLMAL